jgi:U3 small nucleolar RNA-associated protein 15
VKVLENEKRLLTASLDCHVKIYDLEEMKLVHQIKYPKPITAMTLTDDMSHLAVGMADGMIAVTKNKEKERKIEVVNESGFLLDIPRSNKSLDYKFFHRGIYKNNAKNEVDAVVELKKTQNLAQYDTYLK